MRETDLPTAFVQFKNRLLQNLMVGVKASLLRPIQLERIETSPFQIAVFLFLSVLPTAISQLLSVGVHGEFTVYGLQGVLFPFPVIFVCAVIAAKLFRVDEKVLAIILVLVSANFVIDIVILSLPALLKIVAHENRIAKVSTKNLYGYWLGAAFTVLFLRLESLAKAKNWIFAVGIGTLISASINEIWRMNTLWSEPYNEAETKQKYADYYAAITEEALYLQPKLLAEHLSKIRSGTPGIANLYFLGVAGYADQAVFMREIRTVEKTMLQKFSSEDRSLLLVNHKETLQTEPIATVTSIREAIAKFGDVMDKDNDILFIYLTSHGSKEHELSLQFSPLRLNDLKPGELRKMLDQSGIQWRVIVVSACYSGGFIEPLAGDNTLVITAAAADRTSFGCSDENDFTYFGKAYFNDALAQTNSFLDAFELAKEVVTKRELAESQTPSNPQISVGKSIREKLESFQKRNMH